MQNAVSPSLTRSATFPHAEETASDARDVTASMSSKAKRGVDLSAGLIFLILFSPLILCVTLLLFIAQGRPILIRHHRVGRGGVLFPCLKFRTMTTDADARLRDYLEANPAARATWEATRKLKDDPRITPIGQVMRKLSVDELPQIVNVLRGEMSLVGPRPIVRDEEKFYGPHIQLYHSVRPGLTGSWQVGGRSDVSYQNRVAMDADYVTNWSLLRDLSILMRTVPAVLGSRGSY